MAAAAGSLYCWIFHNEYYTRMDKDLSEFRGVPFVLTDSLLDFVDVDLKNEQGYTTISFPYEMQGFTAPTWSVYHEPAPSTGTTEAMLTDFILASEDIALERAYKMYIGSFEKPFFLPIYFSSPPRAGIKRSTTARINWNDVL